MKSEEVAILMQCHCPGLPGTEDPRIAKAVRAAEKDPALQGELARQRAFDERSLASLEQVLIPQELLEKISASRATRGRAISRKAALLQPVVLAIVIGAVVLLGWSGVMLWNHAHSFPGMDGVMRMVEVNDETTGMEMEQKNDPAGALNDWFFDKYGFEDFFVPAGFENYQAVGARLFKQDGESVAQVAIEQKNMVFFCFNADDFGVKLPRDNRWHVFADGEWAAALVQHHNECFMVTFRGSAGDMKKFLKEKK